MVNKSRKRKFLSQQEFQKLLLHVKRQADLARARGTTRAVIDELVIQLLARAGLRANEIRALRIEDLPSQEDKKSLRIRNASNEVLRIVDISDDMDHLLKRFVELYRKGAGKKDTLLETERGGAYGYMSLYNKVRRIGEKAGIGRLTPAMLQHTYMVRLYEAEHDLRYVQDQTGYVSRRTLAKYLLEDRRKRTRLVRGSAELTGQERAKRRSRPVERTMTCEACGAISASGDGRRIESGQFLCNKCLEYFRTG
jgi:integrase